MYGIYDKLKPYIGASETFTNCVLLLTTLFVKAQVAVDYNELDPGDSPLSDKIQISIYPSYELVINR